MTAGLLTRSVGGIRRSAGAALGVLSLVLVTGCGQLIATELPRPAPDLSGAALGGGEHDLEEYAGDVVLVVAWASWCGPCHDEVPVIEAAHDELGRAGLQVVGLNVRDSPAAARAFQDQYDLSYPTIVDDRGGISIDWGVRALPESFVIDREGNIIAHHFGAVDQEFIDSVVRPEVHR